MRQEKRRSRLRRLPATLQAGAAVLAVSALGGCAVGPDFHRPEAHTPPVWSAGAPGVAPTSLDSAEATGWWRAFQDPVLTDLVQQAVASNLDLKTAVLRVSEARAQRTVVAGAGRLNVNGDLAWQRQRVSEGTPTGKLFGLLAGIPGLAATNAFSNPYDQFQAGFDAAWELDLFGRVGRNIEAADAQTAAAQEDQRAVQVALAGEVGRIYFDLRGAQLKRDVAARNLETARELVRLAQRRRALGISTEIDIARAGAQADAVESQLPLLDAQIAADINGLSRLLDRDPGALRTQLSTASPVPAAPPAIAVGVPADLVCRRPDVRAAEQRLHVAVALQGAAIADRYPRLVLTAAGGYQAQDLGDLLSWANRFGIVTPQVQVPLLDGGRRKAQVEVQGYRAQEASVAFARSVLAALHEVDDGVTAYGAEQSRRAALQAAVEQDGKAVRLARLRYQNGLDSILTVLDAERTLLQGELQLADSTTTASLRAVALYKALGGGWDGAPPRCGTGRPGASSVGAPSL